MPNILASKIISDAAATLQDKQHVRWTQAELLGYLNDGQRAVVEIKPTACVKNAPLPLASGTKQTLPANAISLARIERNLGASGTAVGPAVTLVKRALMDAHNPSWHNARASGVVRHYMYDEDDDPRIFYVYPPQPATPTQVQAVYYAEPDDVTADAPIALTNTYANALRNYLLFRAYSKDAESNVQLASAYFQAFSSAVAGKAAVESATSPNVTDSEAQ